MNVGYISKKSKIFEAADIEKFSKNASDIDYSAMKVSELRNNFL